MANYSRPNDPDHVDQPKEWLNSALIFARTISQLMMENTGVVVELKGDMYNPVGDSKKIIVIKSGGQIGIDNFDSDLPEGSVCVIKTDDEDDEEENNEEDINSNFI